MIGSEPIRLASAAPTSDAPPVKSVAPHTIILDASGASQLVVPGGTFLLHADYVREGPDLLLIGADGQRVLIRDFFAGEFPPDLISDTGLRIDAELAARLAGPIAPREFAQAQDAPAAQPIGRVETLQGTVTASRVDGSTVALEVGAPIFEGDVLETAEGAAIGIVFIDDSTFSLDEDARMVIDELVFDPGTEEGTSAFSVVQGVFSFVSGKIAGTGPDNMVITTPVATIGVRGTAGAGVSAPEGQLNTITLLSEEGGVVGEISITNSTGTVVLNVANASISVDSFFTAPGEAVVLTNAQVGQLFGNALANLPPPPGGGGVDVGAVDPGQGTGNQPPDDDGEGMETATLTGTAMQMAMAMVTAHLPMAHGGDILIGGFGDDGGGDFLDFGGDGGFDPFGLDDPGNDFDDFFEVPPEVDLPFVEVFDVSVSETDNIATFTIFRSGNLNIDTVVDFSTFDGTALAGFDFVEVSGSAFFNPGTSSLSVLVPLLDDTDVEDTDEDFSLAIIGADNAEFDGTSFGTATFGAEAGLSVGDVAVSESAGTATFTVTRTASLDVTATVDFSTVAGTAAAGSDYTATSGTLTFAAGVTSQNVTVSLIDDEVSESAEFFTVDLSNAVNAELVDDTGLATISDDDSGSGGATTLAIGSATGSENPGNAVFTVTRSGDTSGTTTVQFTTTGTTANAGSDFSATSGTLTFAAGVTTQFITVPVLADVLFEPTERFFVTLSNPSTGASITAPTGQATITDNPKSFVAGQFLSDLADGSNGFVINGVTNLDSSGRSVSAAGDVNGDGIADFIIGADGADPVSSLEGETYVVFGATNVGSSGTIELSALNGANGFQLNGINIGDGSGYSVSAADVNGDGRSDLIIGAPYGDPFANAGETYVVFGQTNFGAVFDLSNGGSGLDGTNGFVINGAAANIRSGRAVSSAGDVNNDGIQDLIIGAPFANTSVGVSYLVFGPTNVGSSGTISLGSLDGTNGFEITGVDSTSKTGNSVAAAGDFNGDGIDDFVTGVPYADGVSGNDNGEIYVIFGATNIGLGGSLAFGTDGFIINGIDTYDYAGYSVSNAGDVNGDGIADLLIGAKGADPNSNNTSGETYVVFGATNFGAGGTLNLSALTGSNGFTINGIDVGDESGKAVSGPGDVNGDGIADILIGAHRAGVNDNGTVGESYIIFGATNIGAGGAIELSSLSSSAGTRFDGTDSSDRAGGAVSGAGDVNGDGVNDIIIGAYQADPNGGNSGESFVVFGGTNLGGATRPTLDLRSLDGDIGFTVNGIDTSDGAGFSVSGAGDVNGDGFEDFLVGAPYADPFGSSSGEAYLVFGGSSIGSGGALDLNTILATGLAGANGYVFNGSGSGSDAGIAVSSAGDVNGDGIADLIIGARDANSAGQSYVVFGGAASLSALDAANGSTDGQITLVQLGTTATNGVNGFTINAVTGGDDAGRSVRSGDVNGEGIDDLIIGAPYADPNANSGAGEAYVLFGGSTVGSGDGIIDLASDLGGTGGFVLNGGQQRRRCQRRRHCRHDCRRP